MRKITYISSTVIRMKPGSKLCLTFNGDCHLNTFWFRFLRKIFVYWTDTANMSKGYVVFVQSHAER